ncbi:hypothetical protein DFJ77DRAFT_459722 [Powellomyces hirtus]|nr:hypothetical protein DFJ77DRAFT_459722 [Powellomyces hirtus]
MGLQMEQRSKPLNGGAPVNGANYSPPITHFSSLQLGAAPGAEPGSPYAEPQSTYTFPKVAQQHSSPQHYLPPPHDDRFGGPKRPTGSVPFESIYDSPRRGGPQQDERDEHHLQYQQPPRLQMQQQQQRPQQPSPQQSNQQYRQPFQQDHQQQGPTSDFAQRHFSRPSPQAQPPYPAYGSQSVHQNSPLGGQGMLQHPMPVRPLTTAQLTDEEEDDEDEDGSARSVASAENGMHTGNRVSFPPGPMSHSRGPHTTNMQPPPQQYGGPNEHGGFSYMQQSQPQQHGSFQPMQNGQWQQGGFPSGFNPLDRRRSVSAPPTGIPVSHFMSGAGHYSDAVPSPGVGEIVIPNGGSNVGSGGNGMGSYGSFSMPHPPPMVSALLDPNGPGSSPSSPSHLRRSPGAVHGRVNATSNVNGPLPSLSTLQNPSSYPGQLSSPSSGDLSLPQPSSQLHPRVHHLIYDHSGRSVRRSPLDMDSTSHRYPTQPPPRPASAPIPHVSEMSGTGQPPHHSFDSAGPMNMQQSGGPQVYQPQPPQGSPVGGFGDQSSQMQPFPYPHDPHQQPYQQQHMHHQQIQHHHYQSHPLYTRAPRIHKCPKPFCTKMYKNANGLKYHLDRGICEYDTTSNVSDFAQHQRYETLEAAAAGNVKIAHRPYWCKVAACGKKYKNLNGLKYHAKAVHPELDFRSEVKGVFVGTWA